MIRWNQAVIRSNMEPDIAKCLWSPLGMCGYLKVWDRCPQIWHVALSLRAKWPCTPEELSSSELKPSAVDCFHPLGEKYCGNDNWQRNSQSDDFLICKVTESSALLTFHLSPFLQLYSECHCTCTLAGPLSSCLSHVLFLYILITIDESGVFCSWVVYSHWKLIDDILKIPKQDLIWSCFFQHCNQTY